MSLSTCEKCGGFIPLGPDATNRCQKCGTHVFDMTRDFKCPRCLSLEAALAKAEEVIKTVRDRAMDHPLCAYDNTVEEVEHEGGDLAFVTNDVWRPLDDALAAIKETRHD